MRTRVIPCLQLAKDRLVKTIKFIVRHYIGDPINTVKIFNDLEVDELCFLDITATGEKRHPNFDLLHNIANECFMPLSYGGGIQTFEDAKSIFSIGFEKVVINTGAVINPELINKISTYFGNQAVIAAIDVKKSLFGKYDPYTKNGTQQMKINPIKWAQTLEQYGAGEILLTSIDKDGTWSGYDLEITKKVADAVNIPVIANGGAGNVTHLKEVTKKTNSSAVAIGSMLLFQKKDMGVLINYPAKDINVALSNQ
jgi:cyclase